MRFMRKLTAGMLALAMAASGFGQMQAPHAAALGGGSANNDSIENGPAENGSSYHDPTGKEDGTLDTASLNDGGAGFGQRVLAHLIQGIPDPKRQNSMAYCFL